MLRIPIVFSTDHNYVMQTGVCLLSLIESADSVKYDICVIISDDVTSEDRLALQKQVSCSEGHALNFLVAGKEFENSLQIRGISTATYYRLLIPWLFPQYDKIIFSDVDVIFRTSLGKVWETDLEDNYIAAIPAINFQRIPDASKYAQKLNLSPQDYYNAGFLVINSRLQREDDLRSLYLSLSSKKFIYQDQDIINIVCKGRITPLSPKYCLTPAFYEMYIENHFLFKEFYGSQDEIEQYLRGENCILHYAGPKPWKSFTFAWTDWWNTYCQSIFYDPKLEVETTNGILKSTSLRSQILSQLKQKLRLK